MGYVEMLSQGNHVNLHPKGVQSELCEELVYSFSKINFIFALE